MTTFNTQHHRIHYVTAGSVAQPSLLLLHGFMGSHADFLPLLPALSQYFYCVVPDLPGHGQTISQPHEYSFPSVSQSLEALLNHLNISRTNLLGYSMGGRLALYLTCSYPALISQVVLESASPGLRSAQERLARCEKDDAIAHKLTTTALPDFLTHWYNMPMFVDIKNNPALYHQMLQRRLSNSPHQLSQALRGFSTGRQPSLWDELIPIEQPLLLLTGQLDTKFVGINQTMLQSCRQNPLSQATSTIIHGCGHNVHLVNPTDYLGAVIRFFCR